MRLSLTRPGRPPSACFPECSLHCMTAKRVLIPVGLDSWPLRYAFSDSGLAQMSRTSPGPEGGNSVRRPQPGRCPVAELLTTIVQYLLSRRGSSHAAGVVASSDLDRYSLAGAGSAFPLSCRRAADQPAPSRPPRQTQARSCAGRGAGLGRALLGPSQPSCLWVSAYCGPVCLSVSQIA